MLNTKINPQRNPTRNWILLGIPILFIVGSLMHFVYEWSGNSSVIAIFAPTNESVWEHLKMTLWPMLIWWLAGFFILIKKHTIHLANWLYSCLIAELVCPLVILCFYYTYTGALGIESLILDIFSLFLGIAIAQSMAIHVYNYAKCDRYYLYFSIAMLLLLVAAFTIFTFFPPHIPLFQDSSTGNYGI